MIGSEEGDVRADGLSAHEVSAWKDASSKAGLVGPCNSEFHTVQSVATSPPIAA